MSDFLLRMEAVNFSSFFDDTSDVSTIRGAGLLLLDAPNVLNSIAGLTRVYAGASAGLFKFSAPDLEAAERTRKLVEDKLHEGARSESTIMVDIASVEGSESFKRTLDRLVALNRWRQMQTPSLVFPAIPKSDGIDELDDKRPAVERPGMRTPRDDNEPEGRPMMLSEATFARRLQARRDIPAGGRILGHRVKTTGAVARSHDIGQFGSDKSLHLYENCEWRGKVGDAQYGPSKLPRLGSFHSVGA